MAGRRTDDRALLAVALEEARCSAAEGGMPFGAALAVHGDVVAHARNRQVQDRSRLAHAELRCLQGHLTGRGDPLPGGAVLAATEAPCPLCAGAAVVAGVSRVVVGEQLHYQGALDWLTAQGVRVDVVGDDDCVDLVAAFRAQHPDTWRRYCSG